MLEGGCSHEQPEVRARHDFCTDLMPVTANKMSGGQQLFGRNNLVVAGSEQENWSSHYREINGASEGCETASCKLIVFIEPLNDLEIIGAGEIDGDARTSRETA